MPLDPNLIARLQAEGRWDEVVRELAADRAKGINDLGPPRPLLLPGEGAAPGETRGKSAFTVERQAVVILVDFSDNTADLINYPPSHYEEMLFSVATFPTGSMADYYLENSYGQFLVTGSATTWYRMPQTYAYYVDGQRGFGTYPHNAQKLAEDAVLAADGDIDFSQFDNDGPDGIPSSGDDDGVIDALFVVHAGRGYEQTGDPNDIHSHAWATVNPPVVDGVRATRYSMEPEDGKIGVFGHEFGHVLGLPDLYDTDYDSRGVGSWSMMSFGSWGNGGITPVHLDGWCKSKLGFVTPLQPTDNVTGASFPNVEDNAVVYKVWTNGLAGQEYFIVENRQKTRFDAYLPWKGLVVFHVDESVPDNTDQTHYKVAVEQADGLFDLENNNDSGDMGDPWPGSTNHTTFDVNSIPDSRDYTGADTEVGVLEISPSSMTMTADIQVETGPSLYLSNEALTDPLGGAIDPGDIGLAGFQLWNAGLGAVSSYMTASTIDPLVTMSVDSVFYGAIPAGGTAWGDTEFTFTVSPACPPVHGIPFTLEKRAAGGYAASEDVVVGVADTLGFFRWAHGVVSDGYQDQWNLSLRQNHSPGGLVSWYFGDDGLGVYTNRADGALYTEPFIATGTSHLSFWHMLDAERGAAGEAWDGAVVEISVDGGPWTLITPAGGYAYTIIDNPASPFPPGMPCFSGTFAWREEEFDLSSYSGLAQVRFRFGSDAGTTRGGWYIDDVSLTDVISTGTPSAEAASLPSAVRLSQNRPNPMNPLTTIAFSLPSEDHVRLAVYDVRGRLVRILLDSAYPAGEWGVTWDGTDDAGRASPSGIYLYRMESGSGTLARKMVLTR
jgi:immune inhibitor A